MLTLQVTDSSLCDEIEKMFKKGIKVRVLASLARKNKKMLRYVM